MTKLIKLLAKQHLPNIFESTVAFNTVAVC